MESKTRRPAKTKSFERDGIARRPEVTFLTAKSRSSIYADVQAGTFPPPVRTGRRSVGWLRSDITAWIESRPRARQSDQPEQNAKPKASEDDATDV